MRNRRLDSSFSIRPSAFRTAFTLVELLVVIGIIAVLAGILFPVIGKIRESAREADTRALVQSLEGACQAYYQDFRAYPGPLPMAYICRPNQAANDEGIYDKTVGAPTAGGVINENVVTTAGVCPPGEARITGNENAVLGLCGGLVWNKDTPHDMPDFDMALVGGGPMNLNRVRPGKSQPYIQTPILSKGKFVDFAQTQAPSRDTVIPDFVDKYPSPMPILMMRARTGGKRIGTNAAAADNNVVTSAPISNVPATLSGQYNLVEIIPYTQSTIGTNPEVGVARGMKPSDYITGGSRSMSVTEPNPAHGLSSMPANITPTANEPLLNAKKDYPYSAYAYLTDPASDDTSATTTRLNNHRARKADAMILISAGRDRVYGTNDDITNFGNVVP